jgi:hypothetical protein
VTNTQTEGIIVTELVGDLEIPCDFSDLPACSQGRAEWVLYRVPCGCGAGGARLACNGCKETRESTDTAVECELCGAVYAPARWAYGYIEYLDKRPS